MSDCTVNKTPQKRKKKMESAPGARVDHRLINGSVRCDEQWPHCHLQPPGADEWLFEGGKGSLVPLG